MKLICPLLTDKFLMYPSSLDRSMAPAGLSSEVQLIDITDAEGRYVGRL